MKILGAELAAAVAERQRVSAAVSALQRRVAEQDREVKGLSMELKEAREMAAATATAAEASIAESRQVRTASLSVKTDDVVGMRFQWSITPPAPRALHAYYGAYSAWQAALSEARSKLAAIENTFARTEAELEEARSQLKRLEVRCDVCGCYKILPLYRKRALVHRQQTPGACIGIKRKTHTKTHTHFVCLCV